MIIKYLLKKEFTQFFRSRFLPKLVIIYPVMIMLVIPWIVNMDIKNINLTIVDHDGGVLAQKLIQKIELSDYFILNDVVQDYSVALDRLELSKTDAILEIPADFENDLINSGTTPILISINAVNETKGNIGSNYLTALCNEFSHEVLANSGNTGAKSNMPRISLSVQNRYNTFMDYKHFMIPALMIILFILLGGFLPALNIVSEKEKGTIEQINISPVSKLSFIMAKLIPYWLMGLIVLTIAMSLAWAVYGLFPKGSIGLIYLCAMLFIIAISGFGLVVSNYSQTMQQAMFVMFFFVLIFMLLSGLFTPIASMPKWAQYLTYVNPPRYLIEVLRLLYLKGGCFADIRLHFFALLGFDVLFAAWAALSYKKQN